MANISGIEKSVGRGLGYTAKRVLAKPLAAAEKDPIKWAGIMVLTSLVSKDAVNCYYYVTQSLHNKKIPEEKRGFVASLDLMNGILNVVGQIGVYFLVERLAQKKLFNKLYGKKVDPDVLKTHAAKIVESSKEKLNLEKVHQLLVKNHGAGSAKMKALESGFGVGLGFIVTAAFSKRIISPLLGTPMASWYKNKYLDKKPSGTEQENAAMKAATIQPKYENPIDKKETVKGAKTSVVA